MSSRSICDSEKTIHFTIEVLLPAVVLLRMESSFMSDRRDWCTHSGKDAI